MTPFATAGLAAVAGALLASAAVPLCITLLRRCGHQRTNFEGRQLASSGGVAVLLPLLLTLAVFRGAALTRAAALVAGAFAVLGLVDDRWGSRSVAGFRGHFQALARGRLTTGALKAIGGALIAVLAGYSVSSEGPAEASSTAAWHARALLAAGVIALSANAINLLDLRPLRALKGFALLGVPLWLWALARGAGSAPVLGLGCLLGAGGVYAVFEARREVMLGDAGSNLLGAFLGLTAAATLSWPALAAAALALLALHWYCEQASLTAWIEAHPWAAALDGWGWKGRPPPRT
jgi:UDP-GlcNAc:undecaprenyl-phosphate GlcNAc-1-phosphate transferase